MTQAFLHDSAYPGLLQNIIDSLPARIFWKDRDSRFLGCNTLFARDAGLEYPEALIGKTDHDMVWRDLADSYCADDRLVMELRWPKLGYEEQLTDSTGAQRWVYTSKVPLEDKAGNVIGILGIFEDITAQKLAELNQRRLERALKLLSKCHSALIRAENENDLLAALTQLTVEIGGYRMSWIGFAEHDINKRVRPVAQFGYEDGYLDSLTISWDDSEQGHGPTGTAIRTGRTAICQDILSNPTMAPWRQNALERGYQSSIALPLVSKTHVIGALSLYAADAHAFGAEEVALLEELADDIAHGIDGLRTRAKHHAAEKQLEFLALYDPLTGLPNRRLLRERFAQTAGNPAGRPQLALMFLDLDHFKQVNDSLGHQGGDLLLVEVADRLQRLIVPDSELFRLSGDEFVLLLTDEVDGERAGRLAHTLIAAFTEPFHVCGHLVEVAVSIGVGHMLVAAPLPFDAVLKQADTALHHAKESGGNTCCRFSEQMNVDAQQKVQLQALLRNALKHDEFRLHYQPQIDAASGRLIGAEALIRWQHPINGLTGPGAFIPQAEQSGLIVPIGEWALNEACRQAQAWRVEHGLALSISVNLSALQFRRGDLIDTVNRALERSGLPAEYLELELTESFLLHDTETSMQTLQRLKDIGVTLSIDDFGTGYSSLSYLKRLAVDKLKIDQSFVRDMVDNPDDIAIVKAIIQLGHTLGLTLIAEGVENATQFDLLNEYGCDQIQGYFFSRPLPPDEFIAYTRHALR